MNVKTLYHTFHFYYKEVSKEDDPSFEALFAIAFSLTLIIHNTIHLVLILSCRQIHTLWSMLILIFFIFYLKSRFKNYPDLSSKIKKGLVSKKEYNKLGTILFFIFVIIYSFLAPIIWAYFDERCIY